MNFWNNLLNDYLSRNFNFCFNNIVNILLHNLNFLNSLCLFSNFLPNNLHWHFICEVEIFLNFNFNFFFFYDWHLTFHLNFNNFFCFNDSVNNFFNNLRNFDNFLYHSRNDHYFFDYLLNFDNFGNFNHFFDYLINIYSNFLYSFDCFCHWNNIINF